MEPGTRLGHYEVTDQIGKGGMGEVYRARDTKLGREVAIKTLPREFAQDAERLSRFEREAKLLASLNHPNIAVIHGLDDYEGTRFLVLELIEGETLAERIGTGGLAVEPALRICDQIAAALEAAHAKGVVHRDLKPANIKIAPGEHVKVLDFGLAKAVASEQADISNLPTMAETMTRDGAIQGTVGYMSPEQMRGQSADHRADIWAFGCVLFEMLAGHGAFEGDTVSDVLANVLTREPEWHRLPADIVAQLTRLESIRVINYTTMMQYVNAAKTVPEIARELNVELVMNCSVQRVE